MDIDKLIERMNNGDRRAVARLITHAENDIGLAREISLKLFKHTGRAYIVGVTGAPGSGKSTLTSQLIQLLVERGFSVGVIAVDPTSPFSGGALLGDRIRMKENFTKEKVFIRSMANRGQLGGIARATKDIITILDAFGYDFIIIETVGVGQSEVDVYNTAHTTLVLMVPGMGDDIQAFKAGIMEITDVFVVNKMDLDGTNKLVMEIESMLDISEKIHLSKPNHGERGIEKLHWRPPVIKTNAKMGKGIEELWNAVKNHKTFMEESGFLKKRLITRFRKELQDILKEKFRVHIEDALDPNKNAGVENLVEKIISRELSPYAISDILGEEIVKHLKG
ncbi:MAG: methylmalonyl Co-A mutase-associated GTPase MeaB [Promethearchaeota archaeon]